MMTMHFVLQDNDLQDLIQFVKNTNLIFKTLDGKEFIFGEIESEAEFEREVASLGQNEEFMKFLEERSNEPGKRYTLEEVEEMLDIDPSEYYFNFGTTELIEVSDASLRLADLIERAKGKTLRFKFPDTREYVLAELNYLDASHAFLHDHAEISEMMEERYKVQK
jgi:hypothetical protein